MAIISKPDVIYKGSTTVFTLFKVNLLNNHIVSSSSRFNDATNWKDIYLSYVSFEGNQRVVVNFDTTDDFQNGTFTVSDKARDIFLIESITIVDMDGEIFKISRTDLNTATFDIELYNNSDSEEDVLLLEDGSNLVLESGEFLILE